MVLLRMNGAIGSLKYILEEFEYSITNCDGEFNRNIKNLILDSIYDRIYSCSDICGGLEIADYLEINPEDDLVIKILEKVYENLSNDKYKWENVSVLLEDDWIECYFYISVDIDSIKGEIQ